MNERERLIELIDDCRAMEGYGSDLVEKQADHLLANGVIVQRWIPVTERLPDEGEDVLTYRESGCSAEALVSVSRKYWENDYFSYYPVTHWMPLPEPPKEEE